MVIGDHPHVPLTQKANGKHETSHITLQSYSAELYAFLLDTCLQFEPRIK